MTYAGTRRKVFISHYKGDRAEVDEFITRWATQEGVFIPKVLGAGQNYDSIDSTNTDYVMSQIRQRYLEDSTVTIVLIGSCTHSRRYIDWELKSSLRRGEDPPNGLIGILLPSQESAHLPQRFTDNWNRNETDCYARYRGAPTSASQLGTWIEDAFNARTTRDGFIKNSQDMMKYNGECFVHSVTH